MEMIRQDEKWSNIFIKKPEQCIISYLLFTNNILYLCIQYIIQTYCVNKVI